MGESFQDYSWIQNFEADFLWKVSLKMLNYGDYNRFSYLHWVCLKTIDHINFKLWIFSGYTASLRSEFWKFRIFENLNFHPCECSKCPDKHFWGHICNYFLCIHLNICFVLKRAVSISVIPSECQTVGILIRPSVLSAWSGSKTFYRNYQQTTLFFVCCFFQNRLFRKKNQEYHQSVR